MTDIVCFSHLRWDFVFQRPNHLMSRFATERRVFFIEEPVPDSRAYLGVMPRGQRLTVVVPHLPGEQVEGGQAVHAQKMLLDELFARESIQNYLSWYYTPMALSFTGHLAPRAIVYDCMDELSAFAFAPPALRQYEAELLRRADLVFTGGHSLYQAKRALHPQVYPFPSSVDATHFQRAPGLMTPADQLPIPKPRVGCYGVIDERMDLRLLEAIAEAKPGWSFVMIGPVVKIDPASLPVRQNIYYMGSRPYQDLPAYLAGWQAAFMPFAHNEATRSISPTKTLEFLAAGLPVVSTSIADVVHPYGDRDLVRIADTPRAFVRALAAALTEDPATHEDRLGRVAALLEKTSWDRTWREMRVLVEQTLGSFRGERKLYPSEPRTAAPAVS